MLPDAYQTSYQAGDSKNFITKTTSYKVINVSKTIMMLPIAYKTSYRVGKARHYYQDFGIKVIDVSKTSMILPAAYQTGYLVEDT